MIASLKGVLAEKHPDHLVIDVGGVGYRVFVSLPTYYRTGQIGNEISLSIYTHVRDDAIHLYGFSSHTEKRMYFLLNSVTGIGPKLALNILSGMETPSLAQAISQGAHGELSRVPGVGKKTAERMVLELREKVADLIGGAEQTELPGPFDEDEKDVLSALANLGYPAKQAEAAMVRVKKNQPDVTGVEPLLREALRILSKAK
jgi:holliday junction DNA helicase RuvA